jgi:hypothetical protein
MSLKKSSTFFFMMIDSVHAAVYILIIDTTSKRRTTMNNAWTASIKSIAADIDAAEQVFGSIRAQSVTRRHASSPVVSNKWMALVIEAHTVIDAARTALVAQDLDDAWDAADAAESAVQRFVEFVRDHRMMAF